MAARVSIHICMGNVLPAGDAPVAVGVVSIHVCAGNVSAVHFYASKARLFQLIYARGNVSLAGTPGRHRPACFNSYM